MNSLYWNIFISVIKLNLFPVLFTSNLHAWDVTFPQSWNAAISFNKLRKRELHIREIFAMFYAGKHLGYFRDMN